MDEQSLADDQLRLIFTCCHPLLAPEARVALTLREVCGLTTEEIARAFLLRPPALAQRIVRAKAKIREEKNPLCRARRGTNSPGASIRCSRSSTSCSTRAIPPIPARR